MQRVLPAILGLIGVFASVRRLPADWVDLTGGVTLRGIDYKEEGSRASFTLEDGRRVGFAKERVAAVRKSPADETVEFGGRQVTLRDKVRLVREEEKKRKAEALRWLQGWARGKEGAEAGRASFAALPADDQARYLAAALLESKSNETRSLAARELGKREGRLASSALAFAAVADKEEPVRAESLASLKALADPATPERFIPFLRSPAAEERIAAARALEAFPTRRAVPELIETMRLAWTGFGRGFFFRGEERSYIADYDLVSGGTGFSVIEVADPQVRKVTTGVVLDVKVRKVEIEARAAALRRITGKDFGTDAGRWRSWWKENGKP